MIHGIFIKVEGVANYLVVLQHPLLVLLFIFIEDFI